MSTLPQCSNKLTGSAKGTRKRKPEQSKTGKKPEKQRVNKETLWLNKMDKVLNQVLETANLAIRKIMRVHKRLLLIEMKTNVRSMTKASQTQIQKITMTKASQMKLSLTLFFLIMNNRI